ncbi:hypothetical protein BpHYR1_015822 [Brachionus plicatilis]|uniref:Uncharacterized protein n=1 Tax=Brachionus plicatilis TaxID=10195 RepID=A0A3M7SNY9_BRAPC|nr:hypothetical protein BpHYR1_015822 [Brachionus plicatilis]
MACNFRAFRSTLAPSSRTFSGCRSRSETAATAAATESAGWPCSAVAAAAVAAAAVAVAALEGSRARRGDLGRRVGGGGGGRRAGRGRRRRRRQVAGLERRRVELDRSRGRVGRGCEVRAGILGLDARRLHQTRLAERVKAADESLAVEHGLDAAVAASLLARVWLPAGRTQVLLQAAHVEQSRLEHQRLVVVHRVVVRQQRAFFEQVCAKIQQVGLHGVVATAAATSAAKIQLVAGRHRSVRAHMFAVNFKKIKKLAKFF